MIDTVAWVHLEDGRILCARPRGKDVFYAPGGKREGGESDLQTLLREIAEELTVTLRPENAAFDMFVPVTGVQEIRKVLMPLFLGGGQ